MAYLQMRTADIESVWRFALRTEYHTLELDSVRMSLAEAAACDVIAPATRLFLFEDAHHD
jgi:hypothetical protein